MFNLKEDENGLQLGTSIAKRESDKGREWSPKWRGIGRCSPPMKAMGSF